MFSLYYGIVERLGIILIGLLYVDIAAVKQEIIKAIFVKHKLKMMSLYIFVQYVEDPLFMKLVK